MTGTPEERAIIRDRLQSFNDRIRAIMNLIGDRNVLFGNEREKAREMLRSLKEDLKAESKRMQSSKGRRSMSEAESVYYFSAVTEAYANLDVSVGSTPGQKWYSSLYGIKIDIDFGLSSLKTKND